MSNHEFTAHVVWSGNLGAGTSGYTAYGRDHVIRIDGKPDLPGSSAPAFRGDGTRHNPEDLLVAGISSCHMLWYLHLCADAGIVMEEYQDHARGTMEVPKAGVGRFTRVVLDPTVRIRAGGDAVKAQALHAEAHHRCFLANSVNFPVEIEGRVVE